MGETKKNYNKIMSDESICFRCKNCTNGYLCSWVHNYTPVKGWNAIPTKIKNKESRCVDSYLVRNCPKYIEADRYEVKLQEIAEIVGISRSMVKSWTKYAPDKLNEKLNENGYALEIYKNCYGIRRINGENSDKNIRKYRRFNSQNKQ